MRKPKQNLRKESWDRRETSRLVAGRDCTRMAQGAGTACSCIRGTLSPCHVPMSKDILLLIRVRQCGPSSITFNRRSQSKMARADTICRQGVGQQGCTCQVPISGFFHCMPSVSMYPCLAACSLPCSCPAMQTRRSTQTQRLHARVPCTCLRGPLVRACPAPASACSPSPCMCAVNYIRLKCSIAVSFSTP